MVWCYRVSLSFSASSSLSFSLSLYHIRAGFQHARHECRNVCEILYTKSHGRFVLFYRRAIASVLYFKHLKWCLMCPHVFSSHFVSIYMHDVNDEKFEMSLYVCACLFVCTVYPIFYILVSRR